MTPPSSLSTAPSFTAKNRPLSPLKSVRLWAFVVALTILAFNLRFSLVASPMVPIVDGWAVLHRILEAQRGEITWPDYFWERLASRSAPSSPPPRL